MSDWREEILAKFPETYTPFTVVSDPDGILQELEVNKKLREHGYEILYYHDEAAFVKEKYAFRHRYESIYRSRWDKGMQYRLLLALGVPRSSLASVIPYDLWVKAKIIHLSLHTLFPKINYPVVSELKPSGIDRLYRSYRLFTGTRLGENASKNYVLTRVYQINPDTILSIEDLFSALLRIHYGDIIIPPLFRSFLTEQLQRNPMLTELPLDQLLTSESFYIYIQSEWTKFVKDVEGGSSNSKVPFEHHLIRPFIDNLFTERRLSPVQALQPEQLAAWMHIGVRNTPIQSSDRLLEKMLDAVEATLQGALLLYSDWQRLALTLAGATVQISKTGRRISPKLKERYERVHRIVQERFTQWSVNNHQALYNLRLRKPLIVSHICDYLSSKIQGTTNKRIALLVIDGLSLDQWIVLQKSIELMNQRLEFSLDTLYAAIPTLTSISRQAIFSGKAPYFFEETLLSTGEDRRHWKRFWSNANYETEYKRGLMLTSEKDIEECSTLFEKPVIGLVVNIVDESMHGATLGTASMHSTVKRWIENGVMVKLLDTLFDHGYEIYITSDHGNIESKGIGIPKQGSLVEQPGSRVRIYENRVFAEQVHEKYPETILWGGEEPRSSYTYLFPQGKTAFSREKTVNVCHGGISLEEVIVPFVHVRRPG